jgi:hypothetical protein
MGACAYACVCAVPVGAFQGVLLAVDVEEHLVKQVRTHCC